MLSEISALLRTSEERNAFIVAIINMSFDFVLFAHSIVIIGTLKKLNVSSKTV